ncbi:hypothetical protein LBMAG01_10390 [Acidobacteriota bacterium]|jgi:DNA polymerase-3 subunit epsilon|nr:hypothetical protein LBMAG01_10390 [Acidobacteriota bacterium]
MNRYLVFDTETGGLDSQSHSLLTLGLVACEGAQVLETLELKVRHEPYVVSAGGLKVNRINLVTHHESALEHASVIERVMDFCERHFGSEPLTLVGHNVSFDFEFMKRFLSLNGIDIESRFHHRTVDTHSIAKALREKGKLPQMRLSSDELFRHFAIHVPADQRHTALGDALATHTLYLKLVELI